jgi:4'-phosphopantetheinyl transferase
MKNNHIIESQQEENGQPFECCWTPPPPVLTLSSNEIHVWCIDLDLPAHRIQQLAQNLSPDERKRADRFHFDRHRRRFTVARGFLRSILGRYLSIDPGRLEFAYSERGKPTLAPAVPAETLCFNLSHSHEMALYAVTHNRSIGIDIEHIRSNRDVAQLAKRYFSLREYEVISSLRPDQREEGFYNGWTRKEAYLKATGEGLAGLEEIEVSLAPGKPAALLSIKENRQEAGRWSVFHLTPPVKGYAAALVVKGSSDRRACFFISKETALDFL